MVCPIEIMGFIWIYCQYCNFWALWEMGGNYTPIYVPLQGPITGAPRARPLAWSRTRSHSLRLRRRPVVWGSLPRWHRWKVCQRTKPPGSYRYLRLCHSYSVPWLENPWTSSMFKWRCYNGKRSNHGKSSNWIWWGSSFYVGLPQGRYGKQTKIQKTILSFDCWELNNLYVWHKWAFSVALVRWPESTIQAMDFLGTIYRKGSFFRKKHSNCRLFRMRFHEIPISSGYIFSSAGIPRTPRRQLENTTPSPSCST